MYSEADVKRRKKGEKDIFMDIPVHNSEEMARMTLEKYKSQSDNKGKNSSIPPRKKSSEEQAADMLRKYAPKSSI
ncbi:MAG TPA: hypothetical protein VJ991_02870 [Balneolales bacterium]|nr:hypothetical protein [Balneolales bacterium]